MLGLQIGPHPGLRWGVCSLATLIALLAVTTDPADARSRRKKISSRASHSTSSYQPAYAAIVVDANSGAVLHASSADALRHPASLAKIMTLYLLFERLESGKLKLDSPLHVSEHASAQAPTKLGLKAGSTITVEDAIKGLVTRSANDAAAVVAENLGGSESEFARLMTRKAQSLGMSRTVYRNASGLPNDEQVTTARDQAMLGRAVQERFPRYYRYFSIRSFAYRGQSIGNHNRLLGRVEGVDGIKTGYTRASGFNLVTSVKRDNRYLVAVVLGGSSAGSRDARMRALLEENIRTASTKRTAPLVAEAAPRAEPRTEPKAEAKAAPSPEPKSTQSTQTYTVASASTRPVRLDAPASVTGSQPRPSPGSTDPIRPVAVKTLNVKPGGHVQTASMVPFHLPSTTSVEAPAESSPLAMARVEAPPAAAPSPRAGILGSLFPRTTVATAEPGPSATPKSTKPQARSGWIIQVGAFPAEQEARQRLVAAKSKAASLLADADPFTETVHKGDSVLYRARFAGLDRDEAEAACKYLKRNDVDCITLKN
jgi:D-alanyl-D-alanine carboxypeptidase